jgi:hypothetical protein
MEESLPTNITDEKIALTDTEIKEWCNKNNLDFNLINLDKLENNDYYFTFVYTGNENNKANHGNPHHWLFCIDKKVFDSYGKRDYDLPEGYSFMEHKPTQLQHYDTNVCGEYCCSLYYVYTTHKSENVTPDEAGQLLVDKLMLTTNQINNDEKVLKFFKLLN